MIVFRPEFVSSVHSDPALAKYFRVPRLGS